MTAALPPIPPNVESPGRTSVGRPARLERRFLLARRFSALACTAVFVLASCTSATDPGEGMRYADLAVDAHLDTELIKPPPGAATVDEVVATGSSIRGAAESAAMPVEVIGREELVERGSPSRADAIAGVAPLEARVAPPAVVAMPAPLLPRETPPPPLEAPPPGPPAVYASSPPPPRPAAAPPGGGYVASAQRQPVVQRLPHETTPPPGPKPQAGQMTAADHDDLLNPYLYEAYARRYLQRYGKQGYPLVDAARQVRVLVTGRGGQPAPFTPVTVRRSDGTAITLRTKADGRVVFFPEFDRLGDRIEIFAPDGSGRTIPQVLSLRDLREPREVRLRLSSVAPAPRALDLVLVMDTTGSMGDELSYLTSELAEIIGGIGERNRDLDIRTGLVFYRDFGDEYTLRTYPFTSNALFAQYSVGRQRAYGGGDMPESMHLALAEANAFPWRPEAVKVVLLVGDAPPHLGEETAMAWEAGMEARRRDLHIVPVAASGVDDEAQYLMRGIAALTQSRYIFITDDSGIGARHAEPLVACYMVTRLNAHISRVIDGLVAGRRIEPQPREVIRTVGNYDRGSCRRGQ